MQPPCNVASCADCHTGVCEILQPLQAGQAAHRGKVKMGWCRCHSPRIRKPSRKATRTGCGLPLLIVFWLGALVRLRAICGACPYAFSWLAFRLSVHCARPSTMPGLTVNAPQASLAACVARLRLRRTAHAQVAKRQAGHRRNQLDGGPLGFHKVQHIHQILHPLHAQ